ncbi:MAG: hypothetical protein WDA11_11920 [Thiohalomonadaceae bacterium]
MAAKNTDRKGLREHVAELERLIAECEKANDPESKWVLYLLREALEMGRIQLGEAEEGKVC